MFLQPQVHSFDQTGGAEVVRQACMSMLVGNADMHAFIPTTIPCLVLLVN